MTIPILPGCGWGNCELGHGENCKCGKKATWAVLIQENGGFKYDYHYCDDCAPPKEERDKELTYLGGWKPAWREIKQP